MKTLLAFVSTLTHAGVDPTRPRHETKHVVLTNQFAMIFIVINTLAALGPTTAVWPRVVRIAHYTDVMALLLVLALNSRRFPTLASVWLVASTTCVFMVIGSVEAEGAEVVNYFVLNALAAWFVFPSSRRLWSVIAVASSFAAMVSLTFMVRAHPPPPPTGLGIPYFALSNRLLFCALVVAIGAYAAREMSKVERALVAEREKSESVLKKEVSHQVAERSRELAGVLARGDLPVRAAMLSAGARFHTRYRVHAVLGEGGMGAVYEVERLTDGKHLALKVVRGHASSENASRFAREAEIGARIQHPNVVSIVDVGIDDGAPFLVMELVAGGRSLESERARFGDVQWGTSVLRQVAEGLVALHDAGVVHRDLKPGNVLLGEEGARISDFGISRFGAALDAAIDVNAATLDITPEKASALTKTGAILGTPLYMAPEAGNGRSVDAAADVFAFGIIAYEVLTNTPPFAMPPVILALAGKPIPPADAIDDARIAPSTRELVVACLSVDPAARPARAASAMCSRSATLPVPRQRCPLWSCARSN